MARLFHVSVLFVVNTIVVVLLQVAVSRRVESVARAARTVSWAGLAFLAACVAFAAAAGRSPHWASGLGWLILGSLLLVLGVAVRFTTGWVAATRLRYAVG